MTSGVALPATAQPAARSRCPGDQTAAQITAITRYGNSGCHERNASEAATPAQYKFLRAVSHSAKIRNTVPGVCPSGPARAWWAKQLNDTNTAAATTAATTECHS